ncbi:HAD superfamily hydrolase (TIGR01549 family) [Lipingzhangella halophila]|uniref:HAD superfamily hydrolase (TIGR01549 family) n=1 Tax=Lipingzhangella halophila TaxID=1783352 RepID=A0A7W7RKI9_9ACTN|nr:HAD family hydrolase [Lipingzhangella halophila]MBB4933669.1 HAD superfamily hydrolase (TIGR01549 family) [Lipingzhangella halophila]
MTIRSVVFDVGETLVDETRIFTRWADRLGIPRLTFFGIIGGVLAEGRELTDAFTTVRPGFDLATESAAWRTEEPGSRREHFGPEDLYSDVRPALDALRDAGLGVLIAGNQPSEAGRELLAMDLPVDGVHVSEDWGVAKPDPAFFERVRATAGVPAGEILYVGDRLDNDVDPAKAAGMRAALVRRGILGYLHAERSGAERADVVIDNLTELPAWIKDSA